MRRILPIVIAGVVAVAALVWGGLAIVNYRGIQSAEAAFADLAETLRADGYDVVLGEISVSNDMAVATGVEISTANGDFDWRWRAQRVLIQSSDGATIRLQLAGTQSVSYPFAGTQRTVEVDARRIQLELQKGDSGRVTAIVADLTGLELGAMSAGRFQLSLQHGATGRIDRISAEASELVLKGDGDGDPARAGRAELLLTRAEGGGAVPDNSTATIQIDELALPQYLLSPLGSSLALLSADVAFERGLPSLDLGIEIPAWQASNGLLTVNNARLNWGILSLDAEGSIQLDPQHQPVGRLVVRAENFIPVLNAYHAFRRLDGALRADYYALVMEEVGNLGTQSSQFDMWIADGNVSVLREAGELGEFSLGTVAPILPAGR